MTGLDDPDRELDDFLARRSVLHRRLADRDYHEPSQELDRLVLDKAREAIEVRASGPMYRAPRWALPVALAASVVLALAVVMNFARMPAGDGGYPAGAAASPAAEAPPGFAADKKAMPLAPPGTDMQLAKERNRAFAPEPRTDSADAKAEADRADSPLLASNAPVSAPTREAKPAATQTAAKSRANAVVEMPAEVHEAADASAVANPSAVSAPVASSPAPVASNSPRFARAEAVSEGRVVPAREGALRQAEAAGSAASAPTLSDKAKLPDPQVWMREIEQLRLAGKSADADREIAAFRKAFPTLPVTPAALGRDPRPAK